MQLSIPVNAMKAGSSGFSTRGGTLTSPLTLSRTPQQPLEAASKSYIDTAIVSIPATVIGSGTLAVERFPQFTGDIAKSLSSAQIFLTTTGVTAGTYGKINTDNKGRVTVGYTLSVDDVPSISWNKIKTNVPVTLAGYGITDGLPKTGGTLTGFLNLNNVPTQSLHAANKTYTDSLINSTITAQVGDVISTTRTSTPTGFLRCNGAELSKTTYSALYAVIGDTFTYTANNQPGNGCPWKSQYDINTQQNGDITWTSSQSFTYFPGNKTSVMLKNKIHLLYANNTESMGYTATVNADGTLTAWTNTDFINVPSGSRLQCSLVVAYNRLYLIGGYDNGVASRVETFSAPINADGTIGAWVAGPNLPSGVHGAVTIVTKNRLYVVGGEMTGVPKADVFTATIDSNGFTSNWAVSQSLPIVTSNHSCAVIKNKLYVFGGYGAGAGGYRNTIYVASINNDGTLGSWATAGVLPTVSGYSETIVVKNKVYFIVGFDGTGRVPTIYSSTINEDGTLGTWVLGSPLPNSLEGMSVFITNTKVYVVGANATGSTYTSAVGNFTGGLNDYSAYYDGSITPTVSTNFRLPDYSSKEVNGFKYFMKY